MCAPYAGITRVRFNGYVLRLGRTDRTTPVDSFDHSAGPSVCNGGHGHPRVAQCRPNVTGGSFPRRSLQANRPWTPDRRQPCPTAHGVSVIEVAWVDGRWRLERGSALARRITARTPMRVSGPAAGRALLRTAFDPDDRTVLGTINNCGNGATRWGTCLACEKHFNGYFVSASGDVPAARIRQGLRLPVARARRAAARHLNEAHRFGWIVEVDPFDPKSSPIKHTALGRFQAREGLRHADGKQQGRRVLRSTTSGTSTSTSLSAPDVTIPPIGRPYAPRSGHALRSPMSSSTCAGARRLSGNGWVFTSPG
jgi:hypothetical protein